MAVGVGWTRICDGSGGSGLAVLVALSNSTPEYDEEITIAVTATGATSYTFYLPKYNGDYNVVTQVSNTYVWTVRERGAFTILVKATDASGNTATGTVGGTTTGDVNHTAFVTAFNTNTSDTMESVQSDAMLNAILKLKGAYSGYTNRLWDRLVSAGAVFYPYCPIDDSTANALAYQMELFSATAKGTFVGFAGGDFTPNGVKGGAGKYFRMGVSPSNFPQNKAVGILYNRTGTLNSGACLFGATNGSDVVVNGSYAFFLSNGFAGFFRNSVNGNRSSVSDTDTSSGVQDITGVCAAVRLQEYAQFGIAKNSLRAAVANNAAPESGSPSTNELYGHAANGSSGDHRHTSDQLCGFLFFGDTDLTMGDVEILQNIVNELQAEIITGGRDV